MSSSTHHTSSKSKVTTIYFAQKNLSLSLEKRNKTNLFVLAQYSRNALMYNESKVKYNEQVDKMKQKQKNGVYFNVAILQFAILGNFLQVKYIIIMVIMFLTGTPCLHRLCNCQIVSGSFITCLCTKIN